ncbi:conserved hypothetical protein, partial [Trichinella spiralis]|uniref:hypothetical protein n=1 Tax=Trichinella spiralis TaxID=6334 RepID=UPI0001EFCD7A
RHEECDCWLSLQNLVVYLLAILRISTGVSSARIVSAPTNKRSGFLCKLLSDVTASTFTDLCLRFSTENSGNCLTLWSVMHIKLVTP